MGERKEFTTKSRRGGTRNPVILSGHRIPIVVGLGRELLRSTIRRGERRRGLAGGDGSKKHVFLRNEPELEAPKFMWNKQNTSELRRESEKLHSGSFGTELRVGDVNDGEPSALEFLPKCGSITALMNIAVRTTWQVAVATGARHRRVSLRSALSRFP